VKPDNDFLVMVRLLSCCGASTIVLPPMVERNSACCAVTHGMPLSSQLCPHTEHIS